MKCKLYIYKKSKCIKIIDDLSYLAAKTRKKKWESSNGYKCIIIKNAKRQNT